MDCVEPKIDVRIPHEPGGMLGPDCNRILNESSHDWILFLDADVFLPCHPNWYYVCQQAILKQPDAGIFTCWTGRISKKSDQYHKYAPHGDDLLKHRRFALALWNEYGLSLTPVSRGLGGFFLLVNRRVGVTFPGEGQFNEDLGFVERVINVGHPVLRIDGLYVYHQQDRDVGTYITGQVTAKELYDEYRSIHG